LTLATVLTRAQIGLDAPLVRVEVYCGPGLPQVNVVGLAETAVRESRDRVRAALVNSGYKFPDGRVTVNLAPADLPKEGGRYDLAIALGILIASGQLPAGAPGETEFFGELSLSGQLRAVPGLLVAAVQAARVGHRMVVPAANATEARLAPGSAVCAAGDVLRLAAALAGRTAFTFEGALRLPDEVWQGADLADVRGQESAKRALEIAAAGGHGLLMVGPPGAGKSMLAARLPGLLPPLGDEEAIETAMVRSIARSPPPVENWRLRPFRAPHHSASAPAVIGGGSRPTPGEISLAHHGVLFLDELPEFSRVVLEALREPLETGSVSIARAAYRATFPARFQLVAAMNPCPCGHAGERDGRCRCPPAQVQRYLAKLSGPLLDRIDMHVSVKAVDYRALREPVVMNGSGSREVAIRVARARERQLARGELNSVLAPKTLQDVCRLGRAEHRLLEAAMTKLGLSARACHKALRVARTVADLDGVEEVGAVQLSEALGYRSVQRVGAAVA
jgi:magnesium chelatase family protein